MLDSRVILHGPDGKPTRTDKLEWSGLLQDSQDLEPATRTIAAVAEASGLANADYSKSLAVPAAPDPRLTILRMGARAQVTVDSLSAGASLRCRAYVDAQDAAHRILDLTWNSAGDKLAVVDLHAGNLPGILSSLADGQAHTVYFFFWKDAAGAGDTVLSLVRCWLGIGGAGTTLATAQCLQIAHRGLLEVATSAGRVGTGSQTLRLRPVGKGTGGGYTGAEQNRLVMWGGGDVLIYGTVATDLNYLSDLHLLLRGEP